MTFGKFISFTADRHKIRKASIGITSDITLATMAELRLCKILCVSTLIVSAPLQLNGTATSDFGGIACCDDTQMGKAILSVVKRSSIVSLHARSTRTAGVFKLIRHPSMTEILPINLDCFEITRRSLGRIYRMDRSIYVARNKTFTVSP